MINYNVYPDCENRAEIINKILKKYQIKKFSIGKSLCGRSIDALRIGGKSGKVLIAGGFHGIEYLTVLAALKFAEDCAAAICNKTAFGNVLEQTGVTVVPCANPDGTEIAINGFSSAGCYQRLAEKICPDPNKWKANARGVDINHNFNACWNEVKQREREMGITKPSCTRYGGVYPESEPETRALVRLCRGNCFERALALHSQGRVIYRDFADCTPKQCLTLAQKLSEVSGYEVASPEPIATGGGFKDWFIQHFHRCGITIEMGLGENPLPLSDFESEYPAVKNILREFVSF